MEWISVKDRMPDKKEPIVYARPNRFEPGKYHVGIAYWTVSDKWKPEAESQQNPQGFSHWIPLPPQPGVVTPTEYVRLKAKAIYSDRQISDSLLVPKGTPLDRIPGTYAPDENERAQLYGDPG